MCVLGLALTASCGNGNRHTSDGHEQTEAEDSHGHAGEIILTPERAKAAGVETDTASQGVFHGVIPVSGSILAASGNETTVVAGMSGIVSLPRPVTEGMSVARGQTLFRISASRLQDGDPAERARIAYESAKKEYDRASALVGDKIVTEKEFSAIKENYENARIAYMAVRGGKNGSGTTVPSPRGGYVKSCLVKDGDYVTVGQPLMTVTSNRRLYLRADLPGRYYTSLPGITSANFKSPYGGKVYSVEELNGRLVAYARTSDTTSSYIPVTFEFDNRVDIMPGASVEVFLITATRPDAVTLPVSAVTEEQGSKFVYVRKDSSSYEKRLVETGGSDGRRIEIRKGVKAGETVVTKGAVSVKLASMSNAIPAHNHSH